VKPNYTNRYLAALTGIIFALTLKHLLDVSTGYVSGSLPEINSEASSGYWWINWACCLGVLLKFIYNDVVFIARLEAKGHRAERLTDLTPKARIVADLLFRVAFIISVALFVSLVPFLYSKGRDVATWVACTFLVMAGSYVYPNFDFLYACRYDLRARASASSLRDWFKRIRHTFIAPWRFRGGYSIENVAERWWLLNLVNIALLLGVVGYLCGITPRGPFLLSIIFWAYAFLNVVTDLLINRECFFGADLDLRRRSSRDFSRIEAAFSRPFGRWVLERIGSFPRILEIGCGTGSLAYLLARRSSQVIALDRDSEKIALAERRGGPDVFDVLTPGSAKETTRRWLPKFERVEFSQNTYASHSFDVIVAMFVLHDLDYDATLTEIDRLLAPGGKLLIVDIFESAPTLPARTGPDICAKEESKWRDLDRDIFRGWLARYRWLKAVKRLYAHPQMKRHLRDASGVVQDLLFYHNKLISRFTVDEYRAVTSRIFVARARRLAAPESE
jgi:SAM-dependent methyltransferase